MPNSFGFLSSFPCVSFFKTVAVLQLLQVPPSYIWHEMGHTQSTFFIPLLPPHWVKNLGLSSPPTCWFSEKLGNAVTFLPLFKNIVNVGQETQRFAQAKWYNETDSFHYLASGGKKCFPNYKITSHGRKQNAISSCLLYHKLLSPLKHTKL